MYRIRLGRYDEFSDAEYQQMYRLRKKIFHDRLGWDVKLLSDMEIDAYDALKPFYLMAKNNDDEICASWRLLPTIGPNMLRNTFSIALNGEKIPADVRVWELSRFVVASEESHGKEAFSQLAVACMRELARFANWKDITNYVTLTSPLIEKMLLRLGIDLVRIGSPTQIGKELTLALDIRTNSKTQKALELL